MKPPTRRQKQVLDYIADHISSNGYPPTLREISGQFGLSGPRAAVKHLEALQRKGHIRRSRGSSRGIEVLSQRSDTGSSLNAGTGSSRRIPVLGTVPAGPLDLAVEDAESELVLDPSLADEDTFLLRVKGDSMTGDHILPGDMVLVKRQVSAMEGDLVIALIGEEATLKRFSRNGQDITLLPSNPDHKPVIVDGTTEEIKIIGKVKALIRKIAG
jgi:repressor LexA